MRTWVKPSVYGENFASNQNIANSVSACIVGIIQCQYPGDGITTNGKAEFDDYNGQESGWFKDGEGNLHGICGNNANISFANLTASGYEQNNGATDTSRPIYSISGYTPAVGTYYNVTWKSKDLKAGKEYSHTGRLEIKQVDTAKPNHS